MPVIDLRQRLELPSRPLTLRNRFVIARTRQRTLVLVADSVHGVYAYNDTQITDPAALAAGVQPILGIAHDDFGIFFIHVLELILSLQVGDILIRAFAAVHPYVNRVADQ